MATKPKLGYPVHAQAIVITDEDPNAYIGDSFVPVASAQPSPAANDETGMFRRIVGDGAVTALKGAIGVPEAVVGLADIATGGRVGKFLENEGGSFGFRPDDAKKYLDTFYSPAQQEAFRRVQQAADPNAPLLNRIVDTGAAALQNPSTIAHAVGESVPSMLAGGVVARGLLSGAARMSPSIATGLQAPLVAGEAARRGATAATIAAAGLGEGVVTAGQQAASIRQESPDGLLTPGQAAVAGASGLVTGALGMLAGRVAKSMGIGDIDVLAAGGSQVNPALQKGFVRKLLEGAATEGVLEELPQSVQEQVAQNYALGKPLDEGVDQAAVMGMLSGGVMGVGAQLFDRGNVGPLSRAAALAQTGMPPQAPQAPTGPGTAPQAPIAPAGAPAAALTPDQEQQLLQHANDRMRFLTEKAKGTQDQTMKGPDGQDIKVPGKQPEFLTPDEKGELEFLQAAGGDITALQRAYKPQVPPPSANVPPIDEDAALAAMERAAQREQQAAAGRARAAGNDEEPGVVSGEPTAPQAPTAPGQAPVAPPAPQVLEDLPLPDQDDILNPKGEPFKERFAARRRQANLPDPQNYDVLQVQGGFVLRRKANAPTGAQAEPTGNVTTAPQAPTAPGTAPQAPVAPAAPEADAAIAEVMDSDILNPRGEPFKTEVAAELENKRRGGTGTLVQVPNGWVVRPQPTTLGQPGMEVQPAGTRGTNAGDVVRTPVDDAAHGAATSPENDLPEPTDGQKEAGNYQKGHAKIGGLDVSIENPAGSTRRGVDRDGKAWENTLQHHYGYIRGTVGNDQDHVDAFIRPGTAEDYSGPVFVVDQVHPDTGAFDEHKALIGFENEQDARDAYAANYAADWKGLRNITAMPWDDFKAWVRDGVKSEPLQPIDQEQQPPAEEPAAEPAPQPPAEPTTAGDDTEGGTTDEAGQGAAPTPPGGAGTPAGGEQQPKAPKQPKPPKEPEGEKPAEPEAKPKREKKPPKPKDAMGDMIADSDIHSIAELIYEGKREDGLEDDDLPLVFPEDKLVRLQVKLTEKADIEKRLKELGFRVTDRAQQEAADERVSISALYRPDGKTIGDTGELGGLRKDPPTVEKPGNEEKAADKALDKLLEELHPKRYLDPESNAEQTFGALMFKEAIISGVKLPLGYLKDRIESKHRGYLYLSPRESVIKAMKDEQALLTVQAATADYANRLKLLQETLHEQTSVKGTLDAFQKRYTRIDEGIPTYWNDSDGSRLSVIYDHGPAKVANWAETFGADENSTDQTHRVKKKDADRPPAMLLEHIVRVGMKDHRSGKDVETEQQFKDTFGFKDVAFGNWVTQAERQVALNMGYDSLMDMAAMLGMPPKLIGLNGKLGMAFGAAGRGGKAAAHYDPNAEIINLTKTKGDGTVAHEWFHALDDLLAGLQDANAPSGAARMLVSQLGDSLQEARDPGRIDPYLRGVLEGAGEIGKRNTPPKQAAIQAVFGNPAYRRAVGEIHTPYRTKGETRFYRNSKNMDAEGKSYWGSKVELLARGFETFVFDTIKGGSPYLVGPTRGDGVMTAKNGYSGTPYPEGAEREYVADQYRFFFEQIDPQTLQLKRHTPKMTITELPEIGFVVTDQNGLDHTNEGYGSAMHIKLHKTRDDAQAALDKAKERTQPYVLTHDLRDIGAINREGLNFLSRVDAIMEELGIMKWPEVKNGSMSESMFFSLRQGWWPKNENDLKDFASKAYKVEPKDLDLLKLKQAQEDFEAALARFAGQVIQDMKAQGSDGRGIYDKMVELYSQQPNLNVRTATSMSNQAYSTPLPIAFVAGSMARVGWSDKVGDMTGGNGLLVITANPKNVTAIELEPKRANNLRLMQYGTVHEGNALKLIDEKIKDQQFDAELLNPPFGVAESPEELASWTGRTYRMRKIDQIIAAKSLRGLKDDGRATIILGANLEPGKVGDGDLPFLNWLYQNYHVADHFEIDGRLYGRQGANWPIRVLVVAGRNQTKAVYDGAPVQRVNTWDELWSRHDEALQRSRDVVVGAGKQPDSTGGADQQPGAVPGGNQGQGTGAGTQGVGPGGADSGGAGLDGGARTPGAGRGPGNGAGAGAAGTPGGNAPGGGRPGEQPAGPTGRRGVGRGAASGPDAGGSTGVDIGDFDLDGALDNIFGPEEGEAKPGTGAPRKPRGKKAGGATTAPTPKGGNTSTPGAHAPSVLDGIPGMSSILGDLGAILSGKIPQDPLMEPDPEPDPEPPTTPPGGGQPKPEQRKPTAGERAAWMPANFLEIINRQRTHAAALRRDYERAAMTLKRLGNPDDEAPLFSRNMEEVADNDYAKVQPVFVRAWDAISAAVKDFGERVQLFGKGMLQAFSSLGDKLRPLVKRFLTEIINDQKARKPTPPQGKKPIIADHGDTETQVVYKGLSGGFSGGIYVARSQAQAMQRAFTEFEARHGDIDEFVRSKLGYDSIEQMHGNGSQGLGGYQVDAVGLAISKMEEGKGFIIGDDTGVGKGRTAAALLTWAVKAGKVPIFVTVNKNLYSDMWGDLRDIGKRTERILMTDLDGAIVDKNDGNKPIMRARKTAEAIKDIVATGNMPAGYDMLFTTYYQLNTENPRRNAIRELVKSGKGVLIMDESHNMASGESSTSDFFMSLLTGQGLFGGGNNPAPDTWKPPMTTYLSATFAKRPKNMPAYTRTDLQWAANGPDDLINLFTGGGDTLLKVTSEMLVESGSMIRRERSYIGVSFGYEVDEANAPRDARLVDQVTAVLRQIVNADRAMKEWMKTQQGMQAVTGYIQQTFPSTRPSNGLSLDKVTEKSEFASVVHNYTGQLLLATKIDRAVEMAVEALNRGEKPVLTLQNTMEAPLEDYAEQNHIKAGDQMENFGWQSVLSRGSRAAQRVRIKMGTGKATDNPKIEIPTWVMPELVAKEFKKAEAMIERFSSTLPVSPIDAIKQRLSQYWVHYEDGKMTVSKEKKPGARQLKAEEITGRGLMVDYSGPLPVMDNRPKPKANDIITGFQMGSIDVVILNSSASTGISLHASERASDQRPRRMLILQPNPDIAIFKQMIGRIHRTGQVEWPSFTVLATGVPAEKRVTAVLKKKLATLFSNTSAGDGSTDIDAVDFINEYGDKIVEKYLEDNPDVAALMRISGNDDLALRASGKAALLKVEDQDAFYSTIIQEFIDEIETRNATGTNALDRRELPLDAFTDPTDNNTEERLLEMGLDESNPFTKSAYLTRFNVAVIGDIPTPEKVRNAVEQALNGRTKEQWLADLNQSLKVAYDEALNQTAAEVQQLKAEQAAEGKTDQELQKIAAQVQGAEQRMRDFATRRERTIASLRERFYPGAQFASLRFGDVDAEAVVVGVSHRAAPSKKGNPYAPANFKITFVRNIPNGRVGLALSKLENARSDGEVDISGSPSWRDNIDDWFSLRNVSGGREYRWIATENLLRARDAIVKMGVHSGGEIVRFTKRGEPLPIGGILLPPTFVPSQNKQEVTVRFHQVGADWVLLVAEAKLKMLAERDDFWQEKADKLTEAIKYRAEIDRETLDALNSAVLYGNESVWRLSVDAYNGDIKLLVVADKSGASIAKNKALIAAMGGPENELAKRNQKDRFYVHPRALTPDEVRNVVRVLYDIGTLKAQAESQEIIAQLQQQHFAVENRSDDDAPMASRAAPTRVATGGQPAARVQALVDAITSRWKNAPEVVVVQSFADPRLPDAARKAADKLRSQGELKGEPEGFFNPPDGKVYLIADKLGGDADTLRVLLHESLGHFGLRGVYGTELGTILDRLIALNPGKVRDAAKKLGYDFEKQGERRKAAEEVLAYMAQTTPELGWVQRAVAAVRSWLRDHVPGFSRMGLSDAEIIRDFILPARNWVKGGGPSPRGGVAKPASEALFSMSGATALLGDGVNRAKDVALPWGYKVADLFDSNGRLNWWHKSVGTQYNLAQQSPSFKRVFDSVQDFLGDVNFYAAESADLAPNIIPKLDKATDALPKMTVNGREIGKEPLAHADTVALSRPVFEGTLSWARDEKGRARPLAEIEEEMGAVELDDKAHKLLRAGHITANVLRMWQGLPMDQYEQIIEGKFEKHFLKPGVVFTPAELKKHFGLDDRQIALYQETRKAIDKSITDLARSDIIRFGGKDTESVREQALNAPTLDEAAVILRDKFFALAAANPARADYFNEQGNKVIEKADKAKDLIARGYAPLMRFGQYTLDVVDSTGKRVYFGLFETARERAKMARGMAEQYPGATIRTGTTSQEEYKLFAGVTPETLELFGEMLGLESDDPAGEKHAAFQTYLKTAKSTRSAMKRLIQRKGTAGFSEDVGRVLAGFVYSNARQTAGNLHMGAIDRAITEIPQGAGQVKDAAVKLREYVKNPQEEAQAFRSILFAQYLGGSVASAIVNMSQPFAVTLPYLSQFGGIPAAAKQMAAAVKDARLDSTGDTALDAALKKAEEEGIVSPQEVHSLMAQAMGKAQLRSGDGTRLGNAWAKASNATNKLALAWGKVFGVAEQFNRRVTFIAAYRTAVANGIATPAKFAERAVAETQFTYNKGNKPRWARGAVGSTLFTFKQYSINYVELLYRMATAGEAGSPERAAGQRAALLALAILFLMAGADGLPFAEDVQDVIDGVLQRLGYNISSKQAVKQFLAAQLGKGGADFIMNGASGIPGMPIDFSGRTGMGNLIPGTGMFQKKTDISRDLLEIAGPAGDFAKRTLQAGEQAAKGEIAQAANTISPVASRNLAKALDMATTGMYRDDRGYKVIDTTPGEAVAKAIGFQPRDVKEVQDAGREVQRQKATYQTVAAEIRAKWARGIFEGDKAMIDEARADIASWNQKNPQQQMSPNMPAILQRVREMRKDKAQRIADAAPKAIREQARKQLETEGR